MTWFASESAARAVVAHKIMAKKAILSSDEERMGKGGEGGDRKREQSELLSS